MRMLEGRYPDVDNCPLMISIPTKTSWILSGAFLPYQNLQTRPSCLLSLACSIIPNMLIGIRCPHRALHDKGATAKRRQIKGLSIGPARPFGMGFSSLFICVPDPPTHFAYSICPSRVDGGKSGDMIITPLVLV